MLRILDKSGGVIDDIPWNVIKFDKAPNGERLALEIIAMVRFFKQRLIEKYGFTRFGWPKVAFMVTDTGRTQKFGHFFTNFSVKIF